MDLADDKFILKCVARVVFSAVFMVMLSLRCTSAHFPKLKRAVRDLTGVPNWKYPPESGCGIPSLVVGEILG